MVLTYSGFPTVNISGKDYHPPAKSMLIINPAQPHGAKNYCGPAPLYNPFFVDMGLINSVASAIGGSGNVEFKNSAYALSPDIRVLAGLFLQETNRNRPGLTLAISSIETMLAVAMLRNLPNNQRLKCTSTNTDRLSISSILEYMEENYNKDINLEELAELVNYSTYHFIRLFKLKTGKTPFEYFMNIKVARAAKMLRDKSTTVTEVCYACGFTNPSHFATVFKRKMGVTPSQYKKFI